MFFIFPEFCPTLSVIVRGLEDRCEKRKVQIMGRKPPQKIEDYVVSDSNQFFSFLLFKILQILLTNHI